MCNTYLGVMLSPRIKGRSPGNHPGNSMHEFLSFAEFLSFSLTGQGLSEIADLGAEACKIGMRHILMHLHCSTCG